MSSLIPIYYQIKQSIKAWIVNKEFSPGQKIPSESQLVDRFHVSRLTIRQAISQLTQEGILVSRKGEGTFVTGDESLINQYGLEFTGFMDDLFYQVSRAKTKSVEIKIVRASKTIAAKLDLEDPAQELVQIKRLRLLKNRPFAFTVNHLPMDIGSRISKKDLFEKPLLQILEQDLGIQLTQALQTVEATFAGDDVASRLKILPGSPILFIERVIYTKNMKPIELTQSSHPGDFYKYIVRLKNVRGENGRVWVHQEK